MPIKSHTFSGVKYDIDLDPCLGYCDEPSPARPTLFIDWHSMSDKEGLRVAIHEAMHACNWNKSEEVVDENSKDIARFLWRLGFRPSEKM